MTAISKDKFSQEKYSSSRKQLSEQLKEPYDGGHKDDKNFFLTTFPENYEENYFYLCNYFTLMALAIRQMRAYVEKMPVDQPDYSEYQK